MDTTAEYARHVWDNLTTEAQNNAKYLVRTSQYSPRPRDEFRRLCAEWDVDPNAMREIVKLACEAS